MSNIDRLMGATALPLIMGAAMTATERRAGRFLRAPDDHPTGEAAPVAAPAPAPAPAGADPQADVQLVQQPKEVTAEDLDKEFPDLDKVSEPAAKDPADPAPVAKDPNEGDPAPKVEEKAPAVVEAERLAADARRDAEYWRAEALKHKPAEAAPVEGQPDPNAEPDPAKYEFGEADAKYIADLAKYEVRTEMAKQAAQASTNAEMARLEANWQSQLAGVAERLPDFDEKVIATAKEGKWPCPPIISIGIRDSDVGADIAYHLATNPTEAKRIASLDNWAQVRAFGNLEGRFQAEAAARATKASEPAPKKITEAPVPISQARGAGGKFAVAADTEDFAAFEAYADGALKKAK